MGQSKVNEVFLSISKLVQLQEISPKITQYVPLLKKYVPLFEKNMYLSHNFIRQW